MTTYKPATAVFTAQDSRTILSLYCLLTSSCHHKPNAAAVLPYTDSFTSWPLVHWVCMLYHPAPAQNFCMFWVKPGYESHDVTRKKDYMHPGLCTAVEKATQAVPCAAMYGSLPDETILHPGFVEWLQVLWWSLSSTLLQQPPSSSLSTLPSLRCNTC